MDRWMTGKMNILCLLMDDKMFGYIYIDILMDAKRSFKGGINQWSKQKLPKPGCVGGRKEDGQPAPD